MAPGIDWDHSLQVRKVANVAEFYVFQQTNNKNMLFHIEKSKDSTKHTLDDSYFHFYLESIA